MSMTIWCTVRGRPPLLPSAKHRAFGHSSAPATAIDVGLTVPEQAISVANGDANQPAHLCGLFGLRTKPWRHRTRWCMHNPSRSEL
jgi:hypothetical protein